jgi:hypothetical protein
MNPTFDKLYRQLGRATIGLLWATIAVYGLALACAVLGFRNGAESLTGVTFSLAYAFAAFLVVFLFGSVAAAVVGWIERQRGSKGS